MAQDASMRAFKCPSCGAPLEPETGTLTMKCPYCSGTVIIPESLRTPPPSSSSGPSIGEVFQFGLNGIDLNQIMGNAMHLPQAITLAQQGRIDEAATMYSQITGMEHADAINAVKDLAAGRAVSLTPGQPGTGWQQYNSPFSQTSSVPVSSPSVSSGEVISTSAGSKAGGRSCGLLMAIVVGAVLLVVGLVAASFFLFSGGAGPTSLIPMGFASQTLSFGSEGIGAGMLQDPRLVGVDGNGNMVVADYEDGRIQTFDPNGKFVSTFSISPGGKKVYVAGLAVSRDDRIYLSHDSKIFVYDKSGNQVNVISDDQHDYRDLTLGPDGRLYAISTDENIVRFNQDGTIDLEIPSTFSNVTGNTELDAHLAVDGLGNMYVVGSFNYLVLKFSPQGKFLNQFGGEAKSAAVSEPGKFSTPQAIAVDGYGRVYVADFSDIKVFDFRRDVSQHHCPDRRQPVRCHS